MISNKWQQIAEEIRASIHSGALKEGDGLPSESEMAAKWGICRNTAHRAMNELQRQGLVTRKRRHGTVVSAPLATPPAKVAVIYDDSDSYLSHEYIRGLRSGFGDSIQMIYCDARNLAQREADFLRQLEAEVSGFILSPTCAPENTLILNDIVARKKPVVCIDRLPVDLRADAVMTDNYEAALNALQFLIDKGHRRIAYFGQNVFSVSSIRDRYQAYVAALKNSDIPFDEQNVRFFDLTTGHNHFSLSVQDAIFGLAHRGALPTVIFSQSEIFMVVILEALHMVNDKAAEEIELLSFCDMQPAMLYLARDTHRIVQQAYKIGEEAARLLLARIAGDQRPLEVVRIAPIFHEARTAINIETQYAQAPMHSLSAV